MSYSLEDFCSDTRSILENHDDHEGRVQIRVKLEQLLRDPAFRAAYLGPNEKSGVRQIHQDPECGFCVLTYNMTAPRTSPPHDHGDSWAVYGQTAGYTDMTIWSHENGKVEPVRRFRLDAGQAGLFDIREIHSIEYGEGARFVRVTGMDLASTTRRVFDPETGAVREIESTAAS